MNAKCKTPPYFSTHLLERDETRRVSSTDTGSTVLDRLAVEVVSHPYRKRKKLSMLSRLATEDLQNVL